MAVGHPTGIDHAGILSELLAEFHAKVEQGDGWRSTVREMDAALKPFYQGKQHLGCC
jgi:hypothetical protein